MFADLKTRWTLKFGALESSETDRLVENINIMYDLLLLGDRSGSMVSITDLCSDWL